MNLELLDPLQRQIPDRVDSTLALPEALTRNSASSKEDPDAKSVYHLSFNRRGTYLAVCHASGIVAVHDFLSRTLTAIYYPPVPNKKGEAEEEAEQNFEDKTRNENMDKKPSAVKKDLLGVTSVTWSRRSRSLLVGAAGGHVIRWIDTTHPSGPEECCCLTPSNTEKEMEDVGMEPDDKARLRGPSGISLDKPPILASLFRENPCQVHFLKSARNLQTSMLQMSSELKIKKAKLDRMNDDSVTMDSVERYPVAYFELPDALSSSLQIHPKESNIGLAVLASGALVLFRAPHNLWSKSQGKSDNKPTVKLVSLCEGENVTCASFSHAGDHIYITTQSADLIVIDIVPILRYLSTTSSLIPPPETLFRVSIGAIALHIRVSRNGKLLLLNCADGILRLYNAQAFRERKVNNKPKIFKDIVSKEPFVSCDFSGDGEFIVAGRNGVRDDKYELYIWNTDSGALMDRLSGAPVSLYSVAWHPTRSFLAVATSDGLVDVWGPRMDWTAFAPDFQALPMNVEYVEDEDEFDIIEGEENELSDGEKAVSDVDVVKVESVPVFASDSESESEVFVFETKMNNMMLGRGKNHAV
jgi:WD40 repeat protein